MATLFPAMLKEPVRGGHSGDVAPGAEAFAGVFELPFVFVRNILERPASDELSLLAQACGIELASDGGGVEAHSPTDFVSHPVADAGEAALIEDEGLEGGAWTASKEPLDVSESEATVEDFGGEFGPGIGVLMQMGTAKLAVVIEDESTFFETEDEMVVLMWDVILESEGKPSRHPEVDFEREDFFVLTENKEETFAVRVAVSEGGVGEGCLNGSRGGVTVDPGFGMSLHGGNFSPNGWGPDTASEFDFGKFRHLRYPPAARVITSS